MAEHDELVKRLIEEQDIGWSGDAACVPAELATEAAAAIKALQGQVGALEELLGWAKVELLSGPSCLEVERSGIIPAIDAVIPPPPTT